MENITVNGQITANGMVFDYETGGEGPAIVLLHGFPESAASWRPVAARLQAAGMRAYAPNQRGYSPGARPEGVEEYAIDRLASDVLALADGWGLDRFHLAGHDWGASVAWHLAAHHPDRLQTLTAASVPHLAAFGWAYKNDPAQREGSSYFKLFWDAGKAEDVLLEDDARRLRGIFEDHIDPDQVDEHLSILGDRPALTAALNWYRAMTSQLDLPNVRVPTTYVWSNADLALRRAGAERCADHVDADYRFIELDGISHWIPEQAPDALADAILSRVGR